MNGSKLIKRLRREVKTNPKKAASLGLLLLVAAYFWMPLLKGMVAKPSAASEKSPETVDKEFQQMALAKVDPPSATSAKEKRAPREYGWQELAVGLDHDAVAHPAQSLLGRRSPFDSLQAEIAEVEPEQEAVQLVQTAPTPDSLGMALSGTVVGAGRRVAVIGGRAYREGSNVKSTQGGDVIEFKLAEVHPQRIVLERLGERFDLAIPPRKSASIEAAAY